MKCRELDKYQTRRQSRNEGQHGSGYRDPERQNPGGPRQGTLAQAKQAEPKMGGHEHQAEAAPNNLLDEERRKTVVAV
jgi:hypothetical protein